MLEVWYTINLGTEPADEHYVIGNFNDALFISGLYDYEPVEWTK